MALLVCWDSFDIFRLLSQPHSSHLLMFHSTAFSNSPTGRQCFQLIISLVIVGTVSSPLSYGGVTASRGMMLELVSDGTAPQNVRVEPSSKVGSVKVLWDPPFTEYRLADLGYKVFFSDNPSLALNKWLTKTVRKSIQSSFFSFRALPPNLTRLFNNHQSKLRQNVTRISASQFTLLINWF